jgi:hypothetical protein
MARTIGQHAKKREETQQKVEFQTWEGEGGHLSSGGYAAFQDTSTLGTKPTTH